MVLRLSPAKAGGSGSKVRMVSGDGRRAAQRSRPEFGTSRRCGVCVRSNALAEYLGRPGEGRRRRQEDGGGNAAEFATSIACNVIAAIFTRKAKRWNGSVRQGIGRQIGRHRNSWPVCQRNKHQRERARKARRQVKTAQNEPDTCHGGRKSAPPALCQRLRFCSGYAPQDSFQPPPRPAR